MKKLLLVLVLCFMLTGCATQYETIKNKDVSLKIRSIWADIDYDSRRVDGAEELSLLPPLSNDGLEPLDALK